MLRSLDLEEEVVMHSDKLVLGRSSVRILQDTPSMFCRRGWTQGSAYEWSHATRTRVRSVTADHQPSAWDFENVLISL